MCKECRSTEIGNQLWEEYLAAQSDAMRLLSGERLEDRELIEERWRKAKAAFFKYHDEFVKNAVVDGLNAGGKLTIFACGRGRE